MIFLMQVPHDVAELLTFSRLAAARDAGPSTQGLAAAPLRVLQQLPEEAADMLMGVSNSGLSWRVTLNGPVEPFVQQAGCCHEWPCASA